MRAVVRTAILPFFAALTACADLNPGPGDDAANLNRYVAIGTSISMGYASDGIVAELQQAAWPARLAADVGAEFGLPLITAPGCPSPLVAPLANLRRADGTTLDNIATCAPNAAGFTLPEQNLALPGARTTEVTNARPATSPDRWRQLYSRVLRDGHTQIEAMRTMHPTFVSVEVGAAELLPALTGTMNNVPAFSTFSTNYLTIINAVRNQGAQAVLATLPADMRNFPAVRTAAEIASQRAAFAARNVAVHANCDTSPNWISIPNLVLTALASGAVRAAGGLGPAELSCADGAAGEADGVLTEANMNALNTLAGQINTNILLRANQNGFATFSLGVVYDAAKQGVPFNLNTMLTSSTPFGPLISLDGIHPSAEGQAVLMAAAKSAIIEKYGGMKK